jgi:GNAT superfamily N-acetyltransferase
MAFGAANDGGPIMMPPLMSSIAGVSIREMGLADIPAGLGLCRASHWNQTERDWLYFLMTAHDGALVAVENGNVIGTVATLPYGPFAWISMVLVAPAARHRGVGTLLLERGLGLVPEGVVARLDATPAGEVLYRKLGFAAEYGLARLFLDVKRPTAFAAARLQRARAASAARQLQRARPLATADWAAIHEMDIRAFGASRASLLERLAQEAPQYAWVAERHGRLEGYLFGRHGYVREHLGPLVADTPASAGLLLDTCLAASPDRKVFLDVPNDQQAWRARLAEIGFVIERPFLRMHRGQLTPAGQSSQVYAITGPEFG